MSDMEVDRDHGYILLLEPDEATGGYTSKYLFIGRRSAPYASSSGGISAVTVSGMSFEQDSAGRGVLTLNNYRNSGSILVIHDMGNGFALKCPAGTQNMLRRIEVSNKWHGCSLTLAGSGRLRKTSGSCAAPCRKTILYSNEKECRLTVNKNTSVRVGGSEQAVSVQISPDQAGDVPPVYLLGSLRAYSDSSERLVGEFFEGGSELETEYHGYPENNTLGNWVYTLIEDTYTAFIPATYVEFR